MTHLHQGTGARGFTLLELMITVAIVSLLVTMAVPAYKDYTLRSKIAECINGAAVAKVQISEYRQTLGPWPPSAADAGLDGAGASQYCNGFTAYAPATGAFTIDVNEAAVDGSLGEVAPQMTPSVSPSNMINWRCTRGNTPVGNVKFLPATCRET
jgi:type IV pilus assembly protein PilA